LSSTAGAQQLDLPLDSYFKAVGAIQLGPQQSADGSAAEGVLLPPAERYRVQPTRVQNQPQLDGVLDEDAWLEAAVIDSFVQQEPAEGDPATERTVVRLMYDDQAVYICVEAYD